jgi:hypothetical protein
MDHRKAEDCHGQIVSSKTCHYTTWSGHPMLTDCLAIDEDGDRIYISDKKNKTVAVLSLDNVMITWMRRGLEYPGGICIHKNYLCVCDEQHISVIDRHTGVFHKHIIVKNEESEKSLYIVLSIGDQLLVSHYDSSILYVIEFEDGSCRHQIRMPVHSAIHGMALLDNVVFISVSNDCVHRFC